jgi:hypothetical protein
MTDIITLDWAITDPHDMSVMDRFATEDDAIDHLDSDGFPPGALVEFLPTDEDTEAFADRCEWCEEAIDWNSNAGDGVGEFYNPQPSTDNDEHRIGHYMCARSDGWEIA